MKKYLEKTLICKRKPQKSYHPLFCFSFTQLKGSTKQKRASQNQLCLSNVPHSTGLHLLPLSTCESVCVKQSADLNHRRQTEIILHADLIIPDLELEPQVHFCFLRRVKCKQRKATYWRHQHHNCSNTNLVTLM